MMSGDQLNESKVMSFDKDKEEKNENLKESFVFSHFKKDEKKTDLEPEKKKDALDLELKGEKDIKNENQEEIEEEEGFFNF